MATRKRAGDRKAGDGSAGRTARKHISRNTANLDNDAGARAEVIRQAINEIGKLEARRKAISEQIREIKQVRVKGELDMKISDFNIAYRLQGLEGNDRDKMLDTCRECFDALGLGEQLDWVQVSERARASTDAAGAGGEGGGEGEEGAETFER